MSPSSKTVGETWIPFCLLYLTVIAQSANDNVLNVAQDQLTGVLEIIRDIDAAVR